MKRSQIETLFTRLNTAKQKVQEGLVQARAARDIAAEAAHKSERALDELNSVLLELAVARQEAVD